MGDAYLGRRRPLDVPPDTTFLFDTRELKSMITHARNTVEPWGYTLFRALPDRLCYRSVEDSGRIEVGLCIQRRALAGIMPMEWLIGLGSNLLVWTHQQRHHRKSPLVSLPTRGDYPCPAGAAYGFAGTVGRTQPRPGHSIFLGGVVGHGPSG